MNKPQRREDYLLWYARQDLDAPKSRLVTRLVVFALGLMSALLIVATTITFWIPAIQRSRLDKSPLAKSLWIGQPNNLDMILTEARQQEISREIAIALPPTDSLESLHAFKKFSLKFNGKGSQKRPQEWDGRTVEPADPILSRLGKVGDATGIVPTRELLDLLGFDPAEIPDKLFFRFLESHEWAPVDVLFVAEVRLPYNLKFLIRRQDYDKLWLQGHEPTLTGIDVGPVPRDWPTGSVLGKDDEFRASLERWDVEVKLERRAGQSCYCINSSHETPRPPSQWKSLVNEFRTELIGWLDRNEQESTPAREMTLLNSWGRVKAVLPPQVFDLAEIRVRKLEDLKATARGCQKAGYPADETLVSQVDQVHQIGSLLMLALLTICGIMLLIICLVMYIIQKLRCELKVPEIGMLKAMGISRAEFLRLFRLQAYILWSRSLILGVACAVIGGALILVLTTSDLEEMKLLVVFGTGAILFFGLVTRLVVHFSLWFATREARLSDPMESLRYG